jgi:hypothetical protein
MSQNAYQQCVIINGFKIRKHLKNIYNKEKQRKNNSGLNHIVFSKC